MRVVVVLLSVLFTASDGRAETPAAPEAPPDFQIVKYSWSKERIDWEKNPFGATVEGFGEMRNRVNTERRRASALEERERAEKAGKARPPAPSTV